MTDWLEILWPHDGWEMLARIVWGAVILAILSTLVGGLVFLAVEVSVLASISIVGVVILSYLTGILIQWKADNKLWGRRIGKR